MRYIRSHVLYFLAVMIYLSFFQSMEVRYDETSKLIVAYDGTGYCGWQVQPNEITVEGVLK